MNRKAYDLLDRLDRTLHKPVKSATRQILNHVWHREECCERHIQNSLPCRKYRIRSIFGLIAFVRSFGCIGKCYTVCSTH